MAKMRAWLAASALTLALLGYGNAHASNLDFVLENNTGEEVTAVAASPSYSSTWDEPVEIDIPPDYHNTIHFNGGQAFGSDNCTYDVLIIFGRGQKWKISDINLCQISKLKIDADDNGNLNYSAQ